jgi:hypothetical protein
MLTVYRVLPDAKYQKLEPTDSGAFMEWAGVKPRFDGRPIGEEWHSPELYVRHPLLEKPDIWGALGFSHTFAFEEWATDVVQTFLDQAGEQLPLSYENRKLVLLNVTYVLNCLDHKRSRFVANMPHMIDEYVFYADRLDYSLFKIPETRMSEMLCVEGGAAPEAEFKAMVEQHGLRGLRFERIWANHGS